MKKKLFIVVLLLIILMMMTSTGCWNYREINKLSIVSGLAIDKSRTGGYDITFEIVDLQTGTKNASIKSKLLEAEGKTVFDAIRNALKFISPKLYFGHTEIAIISEEVAKEGVTGIVDFLSRDIEPRLTIDLLVSREKTAKELLYSQSISTEVRSFEINEMLNTQKDLGKAPKVQLYQFMNDLPCQGNVPYLSVIYLEENAGITTSEISGLAIFKGDRFLGFLDDEQCKYFLFIMNKIKGGLLVFKNLPNVSNANVSMEIVESRTKIKPEYVDGKIIIRVQVKTILSIAEQGIEINLMDTKNREMLKKYADEYLNENIGNVIKKVQKEYGVDVFGFGRTVHREMPSVWKKVQNDWNNIFVDLDVQVSASAEIINSGLLSKPIKVEE